MPTLMPTARFWAKVDQSGGPDACWPWLGYRTLGGYGHWHPAKGVKVVASRFAYEDTFGPLPVGYGACHSCDNPPCCNPAHLFAGTAEDNAQDAQQKGRRVPPPHVAGEAHGMARATIEQVRMIRELVASGLLRRGGGRPPAGASFKSIKQVAAETGLAWATVQHIAAGDTWKHVSGG
jgi:hypothetical protein